MDKLHFDDLTKITCPPGILDKDTRQRLEDWPYGWELWAHNEWIESVSLFCASPYVYRARPAPLTQDVVPWHLLDDRLKMAARQSDGVAHAAESIQPVPYGGGFILHGQRMRINLLKGYQRGTVHWHDSLQQRPEGV